VISGYSLTNSDTPATCKNIPAGLGDLVVKN